MLAIVAGRSSSCSNSYDPSLAIAALHATPARLKRDLEWTGLLFENMALGDLRVYANALGADALAYRDETGRDV